MADSTHPSFFQNQVELKEEEEQQALLYYHLFRLLKMTLLKTMQRLINTWKHYCNHFILI